MSRGSGAVPDFPCYFHGGIKAFVTICSRLSFPCLFARKKNVLIFVVMRKQLDLCIHMHTI